MVKRITAKEKVLAHLLNYHGEEDKYPQEVEITQEGIAETIGAKQNTVSYAVRELVKDGLLYEETTRVKGKKQRRKGYFLTSEGYEEAKKVKKKIGQMSIDVYQDGEEKEILIKDVNKYFHTNLSRIEIYKEAQKGRLSSELQTDQTEPVQSLDGMLKPTQEEVDEIEKLNTWASNGDHILSVYGEPGMGKSTLLARFVEKILNGNNVFYFSVKDWHTPRYLWNYLGDFFSKAGEHKLSSYLKSHDSIDEKEALDNLVEDLKLLDSTFFIVEDIDSNDDIRNMLFDIQKDPEIKRTVEERPLRFIFTHSTDPEIIPISDISNFKSIEIQDENRVGLYHQIRDYYGIEESEGDLFSVVFNEHLTTEELDVIAYVSIFRKPVKKKEVTRLKNINENLLANVINTPLLETTYNDQLVTHRLLVDKVLDTFPPSYLKHLHSRAADYYIDLTAKKTKEKIESLYQLRESERLEDLGDKLVEFGEDILSTGYHEVLLDILIPIEINNLGEEECRRIEYYQGAALQKSGRYDEALDRFENILETDEDDILSIQAHFSKARIAEERGSEGVIQEYRKTLKMAEEFDGDKGMILASRCYLRLTRIFNQRGKYDRAKEKLEKAIEILEEKEVYSLLTSSYFLLAQIEKNRGNWKEALDHFNKGTDYRKQIDESNKRIGPLNDMVSVSRTMWDFEDEEKFLTETVETCERFGYKKLKGSALLTLSEYHLDKGKPEKAVDLAESAREIFETLDREEENAYAHALLGQIYITLDEENKAEDHLSKAISIYQKLGSSYSLGLAYFSMAKVQEKKGDNEGIARNYRKALLSFTSSGADDIAKEVQRKMKTVPISM